VGCHFRALAGLGQEPGDVQISLSPRLVVNFSFYCSKARWIMHQAVQPFRLALGQQPTRLFRHGRWFEARGWWTLALERGTGNEDARDALTRLDLERKELESLPIVARIARARTIADLLADLVETTSERRGGAGSPTSVVVPTFHDAAQSARLRFVYDNDSSPRRRMPETMGGGVGVLDFDGDGWLDVYALGGGPFPDLLDAPAPKQRDRLFRNVGDGTFEDATTRAGPADFPGGYGHGVTVGDYDNDGRPDLFVTRWQSYALYRNKGDGTFEDVTARAGLAGNRDWPTSAAFADLDNDGDLDLYVCHYAAWNPQTSEPCPHPSEKDRFMYCGPRTFDAMPDHVFRNDRWRFIDVFEQAGITAADREGRGLGVVAANFDGDGWIDLVVTNFHGESTTFHRNLGGGQFADRTTAVGLATASRYLLGFGTSFLDVNNDGGLDLATANGHVNDLSPNVPYAMPAQLLLAAEGGRLEDVSAQTSEPWSVPRLGCGLASGDLDNAGKLDLLIVSEGAPLAYFHNEGPAAHSVTLKLEGTASNRDALGARVTLTAAGRRQVAQRHGGGSFLSACDPRIHFGLGTADRIGSIEVRWPSGQVDHHSDLAADAGYLLRNDRGVDHPPA